MDALVGNTDCLTQLGVTVTKLKAADSTFNVFKEFLAAAPTDKPLIPVSKTM